MSIDSHLLHTADVQRATRMLDSYKAEKLVWGTYLTGVRGRLVIKTQRVADTLLAERPIVTTYRWLTSPGVDVKIGDRIANITFEDGATDAGPYRIEEVMARRGRAVKHISLLLEKLG